MTDLMLQIGASKLAISLLLAGVAWIVQRSLGRPSVYHTLWLLPLVALLVPPLVSIPVLSPRTAVPATAAMAGVLAGEPTPSPGVAPLGWLATYGKAGLVWLWAVGTASVLGWTLVRTLRFRGWLARASRGAPRAVEPMAREIARALGLPAAPKIQTTRARISPMVWWAGGRVRVLIPWILLDGLTQEELRCILAHELAHVRRRDHLVRWLEWLACAVYWWNPVAWWARRRLRVAEEFCCDALAASTIGTESRAYANSLVRAIDLVSAPPTVHPPTFASPADSGRCRVFLEQRLRTILSERRALPPARGLRTAYRLGSVCMLVLGLVYCDRQANTSVDGERAAALQVGEQPALEETLDSPRLSSGWRQLSLELEAHLDSLVSEGDLTNEVADSFQAQLLRHLLPPGTVQGAPGQKDLYVRLSRKDDSGPVETLSVDVTRLRERLDGPAILASQGDPWGALMRFTYIRIREPIDIEILELCRWEDGKAICEPIQQDDGSDPADPGQNARSLRADVVLAGIDEG